MAGPVLDVQKLTVAFPQNGGAFRAVNEISFTLAAGECLAVVGESGSGKSQTALALMGLVPEPGQVSGQAVFDGQNLVGATEQGLGKIRGGEIAIIFQDPLSALNPVLTVGKQVVESIRRHQGLSKPAAWRLCEELIGRVGIPEPRKRSRQYPHELSGGMRQRIMIAMAIANSPKLLIADEPTTALDVTVQAEILELLAGLRSELGMAMIFISHDLAVVSTVAERVAVMYAGRLVEEGPAKAIYSQPQHPYTIGLLASVPRIDGSGRLKQIAGSPPRPGESFKGCPFVSRCEFVRDECSKAFPAMSGAPSVAACVLTPEERAQARSLALEQGAGYHQ